MNKVLRYTSVCLLAANCMASLSASEFASFEERFKEFDGYMTQRGSVVSVMFPIDKIYQGSTTYMQEGSQTIMSALETLIQESDGKVYLKGLLNQENDNIVFATSALYAQIINLSEYLLASTPDISYSPVTVDAYYKNDNYGIWKIYPQAETFVNVDLVID